METWARNWEFLLALQEYGTSLVQEPMKEEISKRASLADVWSQDELLIRRMDTTDWPEDSIVVTETSKNILSTTCASEDIRVQFSNG